jgi:5-methylcytosine-specific restriction endonuclease McrA
MSKPAYRTPAYRAMKAWLVAHPEVPCHWCQRAVGEQGVPDHLIPVALGGGDEDLVPACARCNNQRGGRLSVKLQTAARAARRELVYPSRQW